MCPPCYKWLGTSLFICMINKLESDLNFNFLVAILKSNEFLIKLCKWNYNMYNIDKWTHRATKTTKMGFSERLLFFSIFEMKKLVFSISLIVINECLCHWWKKRCLSILLLSFSSARNLPSLSSANVIEWERISIRYDKRYISP
jgi:hypothetical protein